MNVGVSFPLTLTLLCGSVPSWAAIVVAGVDYYTTSGPGTPEVHRHNIDFNSSTGTVVQAGGSYTAATGTTMLGRARFVNGEMFGYSQITRNAVLGYNETINSYTGLRDVLTIDTGGACQSGGSGCKLTVNYRLTGNVNASPSTLPFFNDVGFALINPLDPGNRSTWFADDIFVSPPGPVDITDAVSMTFYDNQPVGFWPTLGVTARIVAGHSGTAVADFENTLRILSISVTTGSGATVPFSTSAESGLLYTSAGIAAVPEPGTVWAAAAGLGVLIWKRRRNG